jgi:phenylacetate-CoA ligase
MPLNFFQDKGYEIWADAARLRAWRYMPGYDQKALEAVFWGAIRDVGKGFSVSQLIHGMLRERSLLLNTFDIDSQILQKYFKWYNFFRPQLLRGYASSLYYISEFIEKTGIKIHKPGAIISSTEVLHSRMRKKIEQVFGCMVFDSYGCREVSQIATECGAHNGFHIVFENQYVELQGQQIIVTNLNNYIMPFIRYEVGDLASKISLDPCKCGRCSPRLVSLIGRDNDSIELPTGKVINGEFFEFLFFGLSNVIQYQVVYVRSENKMIIKLHVKKDYADAAQKVRQIIREKYQFENIEVSYTDTFDKTPTGKLRFVYTVD